MRATRFACLGFAGDRPTRTRVLLSLALSAVALTSGAAVRAQSITGRWQVSVDEVSNTCGDPLAPAASFTVDLVQAGALFAADLPGGSPEQTPIEGDRDGSSLALGFEAFEPEGVTIYDPAAVTLTLNPAVTMFSGALPWEFYGPEGCAGTQTWAGSRPGASTPGDLSGSNWTITVTELTDTCDPIDPTFAPVPVSIVQSGSLVEVSAPDFGQTRIRGQVSGQTLRLGLAVRESGGDFTVFDAADDVLTIAADFRSFTGTMFWTSYEELICTGVDHVTAYAPETDLASGLLVGSIGLLVLRRRSGRADPRALAVQRGPTRAARR